MLNQTKLESLSIIHWNSNSLKNKLEEFNLFIKKFSPDIITINETNVIIKRQMNAYNSATIL